MKKSKVGYLCEISWSWELEEDPQGTTIFPTVEDLKEHKGCGKTCGIVKVNIVYDSLAQESEPWK